VYPNPKIKVESIGSSKNHRLIYDVHYDSERYEHFVFRTVVFDNKTYYIKLADSENELTGYIIMTSNTPNATYTTSEDLINDFSFSEMGLNVGLNDVYPLSYDKINGIDTVVK
jgi:hypothetical protein